MVQYKPLSLYVNGTFLNEVAFKLLGLRTDSNGNPIGMGSFEKDGYTLRRNPAGQIRTALENHVLTNGHLWQDASLEAIAYEREIVAMLDQINRTIVGSELLRCLNREVNVFITPFHTFEVMSRGMCNATTSNLSLPESHIRIGFSPHYYCENSGTAYPTSGDETLVHELFHAYMSSHGLATGFYKQMQESKTEEEFLAVQVANMYRAETGRGVFSRVYGGGLGPVKSKGAVSRAELEQYFVADQEARDALNPDFVPLFQRYARYPQLPLNPFRDWGKFQLKAAHEAAKAQRPYRMHYTPGP